LLLVLEEPCLPFLWVDARIGNKRGVNIRGTTMGSEKTWNYCGLYFFFKVTESLVRTLCLPPCISGYRLSLKFDADGIYTEKCLAVPILSHIYPQQGPAAVRPQIGFICIP
jgi:hypothetical protein